MEDLNKVNSTQFYIFWRNLSVGLLTIVALLAIMRLLPAFLSPVVAVVAVAYLYTTLYNSRGSDNKSCMLVPYAIFYSLIVFAFVSIIVNVLWMWGFILPFSLPVELIFFNDPFLPALWLCPCCFISMLVIYLRRNSLRLCKDCKAVKGDLYERGKSGSIFSYESHYQLKNLTILFGILSLVVWGYYFLIYNNIAINARDEYIFTWFTIIAFILDEVYFIFRYYNLYLDLKENNEIITDAELQDMTAKTYLRFYVCCGNHTYVDNKALDPTSPYRELIDTPFFTKRSVNGISVDEVRFIIEKMTGVKGGELKFFFGRKSSDLDKHSILRYFYFLDGDVKDYPQLNAEGEWMDFEQFKRIYAQTPGKLTHLALTDLSRLATIMLTEKIFDENGFRKNRLKSYTPTFNLVDVRKSDLDFQDDKWIRISMFNSDTKLYRFKKWWRNINGSKSPSWNKK